MTLLIVTAAVVAGHGGPQPSPSLRKVHVIGHRGAAGLRPENTLAAFRKAMEIKVDAVELDVQLSSDGELVIYHNYCLDPDITRAPDGSWVKAKVFIKNASLAELKTYDVGRAKSLSIKALRHPAQRPVDGERIPSLREAVSLFKSSRSKHKPQLWIEIKTSPETTDQSSSPEAVGSALVRLLQQENIAARVHILSFDWRSLYHVQKIAPDIPTIYVSRIGGSVRNIQPGRPGLSPWTTPIDVNDFDGSLPQAIRAAGGRNWAPHHREVTESSLQEAHRLGLKVYVWTPDDAAQMRRMIEMGVDGIITNRPDILQSISADR
jgi:glycerophosphoryl diester phosphodiesterase